MKLYHGSNQDFSKIDLSKSRNNRDFGKGFYTTTLKEQAQEWAYTIFEREKTGELYLYEYDFSPAAGLQIKEFPKVSEDWFDFVLDNRTNDGKIHTFDIVRGPVANDKTTRTISNYVNGVYTKKEAMRRLRYNKLNDQLSFHTEKAILCLKLINKQKVTHDKLIYQGQDITFDIMCKIEAVVTLLAEKQGKPFDDVYIDFVSTKTYNTILNTASMLWSESSEFIVDEYYREKSTAGEINA